MNARSRSAIAASLLPACAGAIGAPAAAADGFPVTGIDAAPVSAPGSEVEYVTRRVRTATVLEESAAGGGPVLRRLRIDGRFSVPAVAYDGSPSGLSADGRKLVLIEPRRRFPRAVTTFRIIDAKRLASRRTLRLRGDFSFDALSPDGRSMFLIEYISKRDATRYSVRAYDLRERRLLPGAIVDPREPDERMSGLPTTRATSPDGRWEYTLYQGNEYPFIHALDTERRRAFCIDLDALAARRQGLGGLKLQIESDTLAVVAGDRTLARVNTRTLRVSEPGAARPHRTQAEAGAGVPWPLLVATGLLAAAAAALARKRWAIGRTA